MPDPRTSRRLLRLRPTVVNTILQDVRRIRESGGQPVSLMRGEPDLPTPSFIVDAASRALAAGRTGYPDNQGEPALREAIARKLERCGAGRYSPGDEILVTDGATLGIHAALTAVLDPGNPVLVPEPIYDAYLPVITLAGGVPHPVPTRIVDGRFTLDREACEAARPAGARVLLLNTPWNPTGTVLRDDELEGLMELAAERDLIVISDEIYESVVFDGHRHVSPAAVSDDARQRTIVVNSFSKTYAMTGWRLGYCAGPADLIRALSLVLQQSSRGPATFVQDAGAAALDGPQDDVPRMVEEYAARRSHVGAALSGVPGVRVLAPEGGFFSMVDVRELGMGSDEIRRRLLSEFGVVVVHGAAYGPSAEGTLRVSFAAGGENLRAGLERLRAGLGALADE